MPELLHEVQPNAKLILVLCDPALRAFKDYNTQPPVTAFDEEVAGFSVEQLKTCEIQHPLIKACSRAVCVWQMH